jgi:S1-C subfamily serine protease
MSKNNNKNKMSFWFIVLVSAIILGFIGGIFSSFYFKKSLDEYSFPSDLNLDYWQYGGSSFVIQDAKNVSISQDLKIDENLNYFSEAVVTFYDKSSEDIILSRDGLFSGVIISSDGWVLANSNDFSGGDYLAVSKKDKKTYSIEDYSYDAESGLLLIKLQDVNNFHVKGISGFEDIKIGKSLLFYNSLGAIDYSVISSTNLPLSYINTDNFIKELYINKELDDRFKNSFAFDLEGNLVALISSDLSIFSLDNYKASIFNFFKNKEFVDYDFGINYINLANVLSDDSEVISNGALVQEVAKDSLVDLKRGDIITMVNDYKIDSKNELVDVLNSFVSGDEINFQVIRDEELLNLDIILE